MVESRFMVPTTTKPMSLSSHVAVRFMIILAIFLGWAMRRIDLVQAYAKAPIECDMYMELPPGIKTKHRNSKDYVLKLLVNLYGHKQAGHVWNQFTTDKLADLGFQQSQVDECVFYHNDGNSSYTWMMVYSLEAMTKLYCSSLSSLRMQDSMLKIRATLLTNVGSTSRKAVTEPTNLPNAL